MALTTKSAKSGQAPKDLFDPGKPFVVLDGVGRLQHRSFSHVLFEMDSNETIPVVVGRGKGTPAYVASGKQFNKKGQLLNGGLTVAPVQAIASVEAATPAAKKATGKKSKKKKSAQAKSPSAQAMGV